MEFPANSKDWRKFECNNKTIALNVLMCHTTKNKRLIMMMMMMKMNMMAQNT